MLGREGEGRERRREGQGEGVREGAASRERREGERASGQAAVLHRLPCCCCRGRLGLRCCAATPLTCSPLLRCDWALVQARAQQLVRALEALSGESLEQYLR